MRGFIIIIVLLGSFAPSNTLFAQKNRVSFQVGLFHQFFDGTPLVNTTRTLNNTSLRFPLSYFGAFVNDSWGLRYARKLNEKSSLSCEYSLYTGNFIPPFDTWEGNLRIELKRLAKWNITYSRNWQLSKQFEFTAGAGINYQWGFEGFRLSSPPYPDDFVDKYYYWGYRKDLGLNARVGIDYSPIKQLTLYTHIDFLGAVFLESRDRYDEIDTYTFMNEKFGVTNLPSRYDLSLNFGIGFNF